MKRKALLAATAVCLAGLLVIRWGCSGMERRRGEGVDALLSEIDEARQRGGAGDIQRLSAPASQGDPRVASAAMNALAAAAPDRAGDSIRAALDPANNPEKRAAAAVVFGALPQADPDVLAGLLKRESNAEVRAGAAKGLARWSSPERREALPAMLAALKDPDPEVRAWAIRGIHRVSVQRFRYSPDQPPESQQEQVRVIEGRLRALGLLPGR